jgi:predicted N-acetyltransferase YhbS
MTAPTLQLETAADAPAADALIDRAFGPGRLVKVSERVRESARFRPDLSFAAFQGETLTGSVRMWDVAVGGAPVVFLGPLAVESGARNAGTGQALVNRACEAAARAGAAAVLLVGDLSYFGRMGFIGAGPGVILPGPVDQRRVLVRWLGPAGALQGPLTGP